eukprot:superscaffoldBa00005248_g20094
MDCVYSSWSSQCDRQQEAAPQLWTLIGGETSALHTDSRGERRTGARFFYPVATFPLGAGAAIRNWSERWVLHVQPIIDLRVDH